MEIKEILYQLCNKYLTDKAGEIKRIIDDAIEAANNETKSSVGDKYETGREMMQQEIELNVARLSELTKQRELLDRINPTLRYSIAHPGALVRTNNGDYYITIAAGQLKFGGKVYYAISPASPIGEMFSGKKAGDKFHFNGKDYLIESIL